MLISVTEDMITDLDDLLRLFRFTLHETQFYKNCISNLYGNFIFPTIFISALYFHLYVNMTCVVHKLINVFNTSNILLTIVECLIVRDENIGIFMFSTDNHLTISLVIPDKYIDLQINNIDVF